MKRHVAKRKHREDCCPICMKPIKNITALDTCLHEFCLECIGHWMGISVSCPICKQTPKLLLYNLSKDRFISSWQLSAKFKTIWTQRLSIVRFFESRANKMKKLKKSLRLLLQNFNYSAEFLRKMIYFCNLTTKLNPLYRTEWDPKNLIIDPGHNIWQWLNVELAVYYSTSNVYRYIKTLKDKVSCYMTLKKELSVLFPELILAKFVSEMDMFLSFRESCEKFFYIQDCKTITGRVPGHRLDSIVIDGKSINLRAFCAILVEKIYQLEHFDSTSDADIEQSDLMPLFELSHVQHLTDEIIDHQSDHKEECLSLLIRFVSLRLCRSVAMDSGDSSRKLKYEDHFKLDPNYKYIFLSCLQEQIGRVSNSPCDDDSPKAKRQKTDLVDLSCLENKSDEILIDLTDD